MHFLWLKTLINNLGSGHKELSPEPIIQIADLFRVTIDYLLRDSNFRPVNILQTILRIGLVSRWHMETFYYIDAPA